MPKQKDLFTYTHVHVSHTWLELLQAWQSMLPLLVSSVSFHWFDYKHHTCTRAERERERFRKRESRKKSRKNQWEGREEGQEGGIKEGNSEGEEEEVKRKGEGEYGIHSYVS